MSIIGNLITHNSNQGILFEGTTPAATDALEIQALVVNNTISHNGGAGFQYPTNLQAGFAVQNNLITLNSSGLWQTEFLNPTNALISNNGFWGNDGGGNWVNFLGNYGMPVTTNLNGTPTDAFANIYAAPNYRVSGLDFHLQEDSVAIDAGTTNNAPATDLDGNPRGKFVDMGYDEVASFRLAGVPNSGVGLFNLTINGGRGTALVLESSTNLVNWGTVSSFTTSNRSTVLGLPFSLNNLKLFYRTH